MQKNKRETKIIMEHVFKNNENNENLEVALDIISRTQEIRSRIIKPFLEKLKSFICEELDMSQWDWETKLNKPLEGKRRFGVSSKFGVLKEPVGILLKGYRADDFYIGVCSSPANISFNNSMTLRNQLTQEFGASGPDWETKSELWIWYQSLKFSSWDYKDWTHKDTLIKMHTNPDCVVEDIGYHLLDIIRVAEPVINAWVRQNPPTP